MTPERLAEIEVRHQSHKHVGQVFCDRCSESYPCDAAQLLAAIRAVTAERDALEQRAAFWHLRLNRTISEWEAAGTLNISTADRYLRDERDAWCEKATSREMSNMRLRAERDELRARLAVLLDPRPAQPEPLPVERVCQWCAADVPHPRTGKKAHPEHQH